MRRQKDGFAVPSDAEWSTYDVIPLSSRLGARPNPLANWKHAIFCYRVVGDPEAIGASFRGISTYKFACSKQSSGLPSILEGLRATRFHLDVLWGARTWSSEELFA